MSFFLLFMLAAFIFAIVAAFPIPSRLNLIAVSLAFAWLAFISQHWPG